MQEEQAPKKDCRKPSQTLRFVLDRAGPPSQTPAAASCSKVILGKMKTRVNMWGSCEIHRLDRPGNCGFRAAGSKNRPKFKGWQPELEKAMIFGVV